MATATEMVEAALKAGMTEIKDGRDYILRTFQNEMHPGTFGRLKNDILARQAKARATTVAAVDDTQVREVTILDLARTLKTLVNAHGVQKTAEILRMLEMFNSGKVQETLGIIQALAEDEKKESETTPPTA